MFGPFLKIRPTVHQKSKNQTYGSSKNLKIRPMVTRKTWKSRLPSHEKPENHAYRPPEIGQNQKYGPENFKYGRYEAFSIQYGPGLT